jgi:hypothetical protein
LLFKLWPSSTLVTYRSCLTQLQGRIANVWTLRIVLPAGQDASGFTDGQLVDICQKAYAEMENDFKTGTAKYKQKNVAFPLKKLGAMMVLAKGDSVYMMSSIKVLKFLYKATKMWRRVLRRLSVWH